MTAQEIGCCGAYCKTCMQWQRIRYPNERGCLGCKLGYEEGKRDLAKAKCQLKRCCFAERKLETCAECPDFPCPMLAAFFGKNGSKYRQYQKALLYIREHGYEAFLAQADLWRGPRGKLK
jgi:hypothetical protein